MELVANFILNNESLDANFDVSEVQNFDALFEIYASGTVWGTIEGDITNQTDLQNILNGISGNIGEIETTVSDLQTTVSSNYNTLNNSISNLSDTVNDLSDTVDSNYNILDTKIDTTRTTLQGNIDTLSGTVTSNYNDLTQSITNNVSTLNTRITNEVSTLNGAISNEATTRANADNNLQTQIDAIVSSSDVFDIVGTYAELQAYDISTVPVNDIIKVLVDSTHNNAATYYRCVENDGIKSWSYIGSEGAYYTKGEADSTFVPQTRTINNKALNQNINLTASDVGALPVGTQIGNGTILLTQGGVQKGTFTLNQTGNATIDFDAVSEDITVDSELSTTSTNPVQNKVITGALNSKQDVLTTGTDLEIVKNSILPSGYTQLNSITSTGSQYINTGLWLTDNFKAEIVGRFTSTTGTQCMLGATVRTSNTTYRNIVLGKNASQYYVGNGSPWYQPNQTNSSATLDTNEHTFVIEITSETTKISIDGVENTASYTSSSIEENLYLFANNAIMSGGTSSAADFARFEAKLVKLYDNGNLIFNGVPCKRGDIAGLYDVVSDTFMPSLGSSAFVAGEETQLQNIINFTNESGYINETDLQTALEGKQDTLVTGTDLEIIKGSSVHNLPEGYTEVEYIQASGDAGIITSVAGNINTNVTLIANCTQVTYASQVILSDGYDGNGGTYVGQPSTKSTWGAGTSGSQITSLNVLIKTEFNISSTITNTFALNGTVAQGSTIQTFSRLGTVSVAGNYTNWSLFGSINKNTNTIAYATYGKVFYAKFEQNNTVVAEYIPAIRNSDNEVGLYDIINNTFIARNLGTGTLIAGEKVVETATINFTNESGYTKNKGTVTSVNGVQPDTNGNVTIETGGVTDVEVNGNSVVTDGVAEIDLTGYQEKLTTGTDLEIIGGGIQLPSGYTALEYITASGAQYIVTNFIPDITKTYTFQTEVLFSVLPTSEMYFAGLRMPKRFQPVGSYSSRLVGGFGDNWTYYSNTLATNYWYPIIVTIENGSQNFNGTATSYTTNTTWTSPLVLFAQSKGSEILNFAVGSMKIFKILDGSTLIHQYVPCKHGDIVGMYDTVEDEFFTNDGTGVFIAGAEVSALTINFTNESGYTKNKGTVTSVNGVQPDTNGNVTIETGGVTDVEVNGNSVVTDGVAEIDLTGYQEKLTAGTDLEIVEGSSARLPQGFTEVEYIQCNGVCLIDLGIVSYSTDVIEQKFQNLISRPSQVASWFGSMEGSNLIRLSIGYNPPNQKFWGSFNCTTTLSSVDTNIHTIKIYKADTRFIAEFDGIPNSYTPSTLVEPSINSYLFARNGANGASVVYGQNIRIYYHKQTRSGAYILDLVPCRREADGELGFYNLVNNEFLTSTDNTQLSAGADVIFNPTTVINFTNETGYTTNKGTVTSVNNIQPDASGNVAITIPTVNNGTLTIKQNGNTLGTFGANQRTNSTINIPASGSSHWEQGSSELILAVASNDHSEVVDILYNNNYIAITEEGGVYTSADGATWNYDHAMVSYEQLDYYYWKSICYGNGMYLAMNQAGYYSTSTDVSNLGSNVMTTPTASFKWVSVAFGKGKFVALKNDGSIKTSTNGSTWTTATQVANLGNNNWESIIFGGDKFVALSENGYISTSTDGITWTVATQNNNLGANSWRDLSYNGGQYIAVSHTGYYSTSTDGTIWTVAKQIGTKATDSVTYANNKFLVATTGGALRWFVLSAQDLLYTKANTDLSNTTDSAKVLMSGMGMPSDKYIDLTLGASKSTYTAPANGWYNLSKNASANGQWCDLRNVTNGFYISSPYLGSASVFRSAIPVKKNDVLQISYNLGGATNFFRFYYAVGSESETN